MGALDTTSDTSQSGVDDAKAVFVSVAFLADRWGIADTTVRRCAKRNPEYPQIHKFGPRCSRISLADIESYERTFRRDSSEHKT